MDIIKNIKRDYSLSKLGIIDTPPIIEFLTEHLTIKSSRKASMYYWYINTHDRVVLTAALNPRDYAYLLDEIYFIICDNFNLSLSYDCIQELLRWWFSNQPIVSKSDYLYIYPRSDIFKEYQVQL